MRHASYILLLISLLTTGLASGQSSQSYNLKASFSGGAAMSTSGSYQVSTSVGNPLSGNSSSPSFSMSTGSASIINNAASDLVLTESTASSTVAPGGKVTINFTLKNNGTLPVQSAIVVKAYLSDNTTFESNTDIELQPSFTVANSLASNASSVFPAPGGANQVTIPAGTVEKSYQLLLVIDPANTVAEGNETNNITAKSLTVSSGGGTVDTTGPTLADISRPSSFAAGSAIAITVTDNSPIQNVTLMRRKVTSSTWVPQTTTNTTTRYSTTIAADWTDEVGIEYYFTATDNLNNKTEGLHYFLYNPVPTDQPIPGLVFGGRVEDYRIFSIPYDLEEDRIDEIFKSLGEYDKTEWRIVRYQGGKNVDKKEGLTRIERGQGFWFNTVEKADIMIGTGTTVKADESPDFSMTLEKGYNQIGNPFTFDVDWADVVAQNPALSSKLSHTLLTYNNTKVSLDESGVLKSWSGGFVLADEQMTISMPVSLKNSFGRVASTRILNSDPDQEEWRFSLELHQGGVVNSLAGIGMHPNASLSKDIYDIITPPHFTKYVGIHTEHTDFFEHSFSTDIVPANTSYNWHFNLQSTLNTSTAEITWNNSQLSGSVAELLLYDVDRKTLIDMKQSDRYSFDPQRSRSFRVFFGSDRKSLRPDVQEVGVAWPNPVSETVNVPYLIGEGSPVRIDIYDLVGRHINTLVNGFIEAGYHTAKWNLTGRDGSKVTPGVYIYRMSGSTNVGRIIVN